ncbi:bifunctional diaminohydroxyphosphoribosylaminopyrimidine deaminase/5-amino-6-(5-phosphoribosylamino)uracil reductase RibD [uncultured Polaribacter sp.]|uniref:bifunctional diaminohydroxyphosphoribosylaminopyrimidine deaminase/5-amino-6-(5-phosphoribosylamino)uracil reductase RibD n=1 Tax=uncultured Polaribacter sp. TaxID=174711 RepID=UPI002618CDA8|nr:bifunctional diaminohydroxyphosphoribosylaminopyrimidine deaminase/5-amino-6-(5-phosphoribosylamino)uracil reductase RibD [uncultured Polaribacter sp.]
MQKTHEKFIKRALQIAKNGLGTARPNPSVGAVIVFDHKIIGEGFTSPYGENHAEVNAINAVEDKTLLKQATIYVTLEPCSHFGKTPPCADLIVKYQLNTVVIGCVDSNSLVAGKGIERIKKAGINVKVGVLEKECLAHHKRFFTNQHKKRPYVILKWAETKDGFIAPIKDFKNTYLAESKSEEKVNKFTNELPNKAEKSIIRNDAKPVWISNAYSQQVVHKLRAKEHAILVGTNTVLADNSKLNVRSWSGQNPIRIVLDRTLRIPKNGNILDGSVKTIVIYDENIKRNNKEFQPLENTIFEQADFSPLGKLKAATVCNILHKHNIMSVIIEGGTQTLQTFIDENLWDEAFVFIGDNSFKRGIKAPVLQGDFTQKNIKNDILKKYTND